MRGRGQHLDILVVAPAAAPGLTAATGACSGWPVSMVYATREDRPLGDGGRNLTPSRDLARAERGGSEVLSVDDWAEIRRL